MEMSEFIHCTGTEDTFEGCSVTIELRGSSLLTDIHIASAPPACSDAHSGARARFADFFGF